MIFPLQSLLAEYREVGLIVAVLIGFSFGFVLERAGFGRATKLAGQFYLHDMTVFKVMFGAIVTAMLGLLTASGFGLVELKAISESAASETFIWPMLVGGLMLGAGFIISGYCPGTSLVATASGNLDGLVTFIGVGIGSVLYSEFFPVFEAFHNSGAKGHLFLYQWLNVHPAWIATGITAMAAGCFLGAEKLEQIFSKKRGYEEEPETNRKVAFLVFAGGTALVVLGAFMPVTTAAPQPPQPLSTMAASQLAQRLFDDPWNLRLIDVRSETACAQKRVPGSECVPAKALKDLGIAYSPVSKDIVLIADGDLKNVPDAAAGFKGKIYALKGGFNGWKQYALSPPKMPDAQADAASLAAYEFQSAVHRSMTGKKAAAPPPRPAVQYVPKKKKKGGGCS